jgi:uncharacterized protein (TIGR02453 family)
MAFKGWPAEAIEFFEGLEADNTKAYWQEHKAVYERDVLAPMEALLEDLSDEFGAGRVYRPYRDTRFSKDKTPYKTTIAASNETGYVSLSSRTLGTGTGMWMPMPDQLARYREAVADDRTGPELEKIAAALRKKGAEVSGHDALKTAPKGYPKDHPRIELLRQKGLVSWKEWPVGAWLGRRTAMNRIVEFLHDSAGLNGWLDKHVGPSTMPAAAR